MTSTATELDTHTLDQARELEVYTAKGEKVKFGSIFENRKVVVVFLSASYQMAPHPNLDSACCTRALLLRGMHFVAH